MPASSVPKATLGPTGFILPADSDVLAAVQSDINSAFGGGLDPALSTPQGQLATSIASIISDKNTQFLQIVSQVDPQFSSGRMQDGIGNLYFMTRTPASSTQVTCTCVGLVGTVIPANSQAIDTSGNIYLAVTGGTIPASGTLSLVFAGQATGPIPCPAASLTAIYVTIPGWNTITNPAPGILGQNVETPQAFEVRRAASVAVNAVGSLPSIYGAVFASFPAGNPALKPSDVYVAENVLDTTAVVGGVTLAAHSVFVAAAGGDPLSIATAIWKKKSVGCNYNGNITPILVYDTSGYNVPYPVYSVNYTVPTAVPIKFAVSIVNLTALPANIITLVQTAILNAFAGLDGGVPMRIGYAVVASRFYSPVALADKNVQIISILVGSATPTLTTQAINIDQLPTIALSNITVTLV